MLYDNFEINFSIKKSVCYGEFLFKLTYDSSCLLPSGISGKQFCQGRRLKGWKFNPWVGNIPWSRKWQTTPVFLPQKFHGQRSLAGYSPWGNKESHTHTSSCLHCLQTKWMRQMDSCLHLLEVMYWRPTLPPGLPLEPPPIPSFLYSPLLVELRIVLWKYANHNLPTPPPKPPCTLHKLGTWSTCLIIPRVT